MRKRMRVRPTISNKILKFTSHLTVWLFVMVLSSVLQARPVTAQTEVTVQQSEAGRQLTLEVQKYLFWQQLNQARSNPLAVVQRLNLSLADVQKALGGDAWILDEGLPPLAWNDQLGEAASLHGRDMLANVYYSDTSLDGRLPADRIEEVGYQAIWEDETLGLLVFDHYIDYTRAIEALIDNLLRDELLGEPGVVRKVFSADFSEVGMSFFAETIPMLADQPYVYLLVIDFAKPLLPKTFIVGSVDDSNVRLGMQKIATGFWDSLPLLPGGEFQVVLPEGGARFVVLNDLGQVLADRTVTESGEIENIAIDLHQTAEVTENY